MQLFLFLLIALSDTPPTYTSNVYAQMQEIRIDEPLFRHIRRIEVIGDNRIALFDFASTSIIIIDSSGNTIAKLGRSGAGPGEFRRIADFTATGDQIFIYDNSHYKISVFNTNADFLNEFRVDKKAFHMTTNGQSLFLYNTMDIQVKEPLIYQLDVQSGTIQNEFGGPSQLLLDMKTGTTGAYRSITSIDKRVCTAHPYEYTIHCYGDDGGLLFQIDGKASEFQKAHPEYFVQHRVDAITHVTTGLFSHADQLYLMYRNLDKEVNFLDTYKLDGSLLFGSSLIDDLNIIHIDSKTGMAFSAEYISTPSEDYTLLKIFERINPN